MKEKTSNIHILITGGTIDSHYDGTKDTVVPNKFSIIPHYLKGLRLYDKIIFSEVCMKDSRELVQDDRKNILKEISKSPCKKIIITHGTYTMPDTARYLEKNLKRKDQTIILTGSLMPMTEFTGSDGPFNLGFSIAKSYDLTAGIYVCMNGRIFIADEVAKGISEGKFYSIFGEKK